MPRSTFRIRIERYQPSRATVQRGLYIRVNRGAARAVGKIRLCINCARPAECIELALSQQQAKQRL